MLHYQTHYHTKMKWAVFEFEDFSCEVGESSWILGEDENLFNNDDWFPSKEIIVKWPKDCGKLRKILPKESVCINEVETERYPAKIVKFSGKYENRKQGFNNNRPARQVLELGKIIIFILQEFYRPN